MTGLWEPGYPSSIVLVGCPLRSFWDFVSDSESYVFKEVVHRLGSAKGFGEKFSMQLGIFPTPVYPQDTGGVLLAKATTFLNQIQHT